MPTSSRRKKRRPSSDLSSQSTRSKTRRRTSASAAKTSPTPAGCSAPTRTSAEARAGTTWSAWAFRSRWRTSTNSSSPASTVARGRRRRRASPPRRGSSPTDLIHHLSHQCYLLSHIHQHYLLICTSATCSYAPVLPAYMHQCYLPQLALNTFFAFNINISSRLSSPLCNLDTLQDQSAKSCLSRLPGVIWQSTLT